MNPSDDGTAEQRQFTGLSAELALDRSKLRLKRLEDLLARPGMSAHRMGVVGNLVRAQTAIVRLRTGLAGVTTGRESASEMLA